jgi:hypothetical protein
MFEKPCRLSIASKAFKGGGGGSAPKTPPFHPIDIGKISQAALSQDQAWYQSLGFPVFPGLADARQAEIQDAYKQLTGPLAPEFQQDFMNRATLGTQSSLGGGNLYSGMNYQKGSIGMGAQTADFTRQVLAKQDYDRGRMESLIQQNPIPGLGLSQGDILSMAVYNTNAQNQWAMSNYANQIAGANSAFAAQQSMLNSIGNAVGGLGKVFGSFDYGGSGGVNQIMDFFSGAGTI